MEKIILISINRVTVDFSKAKLRARDDLKLTIENIFMILIVIK